MGVGGEGGGAFPSQSHVKVNKGGGFSLFRVPFLFSVYDSFFVPLNCETLGVVRGGLRGLRAKLEESQRRQGAEAAQVPPITDSLVGYYC